MGMTLQSQRYMAGTAKPKAALLLPKQQQAGKKGN
jgi:hypothetical protein